MRLFGFDISFSRAASFEQRNTSPDVNSVTADVTWGLFREWMNGVSVSREKALSIPAVWAAVKTIAETLASLPFGLFERSDDGAKAAERHPVENLIRLEPSEHYSSYEFRRAMFAAACFGNAYALIHRNGIGRPIELEILDPLSVEIFQADSGKRVYIVHHRVGTGVRRLIVQPRDMIHLRGLSLDGITGLSTATVHRDVHAGGIAAQEFANYYFSNGAHVSGALVYPGELKGQQRENAEKKMRSRNTGVRNAGSTLILDGGVKYEKFSQNPAEAGLTEYRNMVVMDQARIFGVPAHLLAQLDRATFNNIETMNVQFVVLCLRPWAVQAEQEFARKLLTADEKMSGRYFVRFNLDGLLRGDTKSRAEYYRTLFAVGAMSPNDIRELENQNRRDGGDEYFVPLNMQGSESPTPEEMATIGEAKPDETNNADEDAAPQAN